MENVFALTATGEKGKGVKRGKTATPVSRGLRKGVDPGAYSLPTRHARQTVWFLCEQKRKEEGTIRMQETSSSRASSAEGEDTAVYRFFEGKNAVSHGRRGQLGPYAHPMGHRARGFSCFLIPMPLSCRSYTNNTKRWRVLRVSNIGEEEVASRDTHSFCLWSWNGGTLGEVWMV